MYLVRRTELLHDRRQRIRSKRPNCGHARLEGPRCEPSRKRQFATELLSPKHRATTNGCSDVDAAVFAHSPPVEASTAALARPHWSRDEVRTWSRVAYRPWRCVLQTLRVYAVLCSQHDPLHHQRASRRVCSLSDTLGWRPRPGRIRLLSHQVCRSEGPVRNGEAALRTSDRGGAPQGLRRADAVQAGCNQHSTRRSSACNVGMF